jgi:hypothetical protein
MLLSVSFGGLADVSVTETEAAMIHRINSRSVLTNPSEG